MHTKCVVENDNGVTFYTSTSITSVRPTFIYAYTPCLLFTQTLHLTQYIIFEEPKLKDFLIYIYIWPSIIYDPKF